MESERLIMKTATVTWVSYHNYGTFLQAYALQKKVEQLGHENIILSDQEILKEFRKSNPIIKKKEILDPENESKSILLRIAGIARHPRRIRRALIARIDREKYEQPFTESHKLFDDFKKEELEVLYDVSIKNLSDINDKFDAFITGSDQIWSVFDDRFNPYYYLNFVTKRKIAYAPCLGTDRISQEKKGEIRQLLADFFAISVRESASAKQLSEIMEKEIEWVADPTILQDSRFWNEFAADVPQIKGRYLLCYFLENRGWYFNYARKVAKQLHLDIVLIPNKWEYINCEYITKRGVGPKEFVSLIQHAEYVLTDSYHGSIFSLIFKKQFQYLLRFSDDDPNSQNIRIQSLFDYFELDDRIITENNTNFYGHMIRYEKVNEKIEMLRKKSLRYLEESLK